MATTAWTDDEEELLQGLPWIVQLVYLRGLRRFMDYSTGVVGVKRGISRQSLAETLYVEPVSGRHTKDSGAPTISAIRNALERLESIGLIEKIPHKDKLIFFLPKAARDDSDQKRSVRGTSEERPTPATEEQPVKVAVKQVVKVIDSLPASDHLIPTIERSVPPPLSVNRKEEEKEKDLTHMSMDTKFLPLSASDDPVKRVFGYWQEELHKPGHKLDEKRRKAIASRLGDGYTVEQLMAAIRGCAATPFNQGQNKGGAIFDDIELICRDASHTDRFIGAATKQQSKADEWADFLAMDRVIKGECSHG